MEILFLDSSPSVHHERFVELFSSIGNVHSTFIDLRQEPPVVSFNLILFADLDITVDYAIRFSGPKIGLSWAWDLQQTLRPGLAARHKLIKAINSVDMLIVDNSSVEHIAIGLGALKRRIFRAPYGIEIENYSLRRFKNSRTGHLRLYTNRKWGDLYRPQILLEMAYEFANSGKSFQLVLANDGPLRKSLIRKYSSLFDTGICTWLGKVSPSQNITELENADLYVSVSKSDGSSLSLLEAMAIGTPTLVTSNHANKEWIVDNLTGYLFSGNTGLELAKKIQDIELDFPVNQQMSKLAHEKISREANWSLTRQLLLAKVQQILKEH